MTEPTTPPSASAARPALDPVRWKLAQEVFEQLLDLPADERSAALASTLANDDELRALVSEMLGADAEAAHGPATGAGLLHSELLKESLNASSWGPGTLVGVWEIEAEIGRGGMGEVYRAHRVDGAVSHTVAIKRLSRVHSHPELMRRFLAERRILARLRHPNIASFLDAGTDSDGQPFAVMEYIRGIPITQHAWQPATDGGSRAGLDLRQRVELLLKTAAAVAHAHRQLVVHRDLKPGNVLVDEQGEPRLLDFGIAKPLAELDDPILTAHQTAFGMQAFSLGYAAPEQLRGDAVGVGCDVYGLGSLLYELLCGRPPLELDGLSYGEAERRVLEQWPLPPSARIDPQRIVGPAADWSRQLRGDLDNIVLHALEKDPARRYASVDAFSEDLQRVLEHQPISLRRDHRWYRWARYVRRHRLPLALTAAVLLTLLMGGVLLLAQSRVVARERDNALRALDRAESVTRLLTDAFQAADPSRQQGNHLSARDVLTVAAGELQNATKLDPVARAVLATTVADVQLSLGDGKASRALMEDITRTLSADLPALDRARAWRARAESERIEGNPQVARDSLQQAGIELAAAATSPAVRREAFEQGASAARQLISDGQPLKGLDAWKALYAEASRELQAGDPLVLEIGEGLVDQLQGLKKDVEALALAEQLVVHIPDLERSAVGRRLLGQMARIARGLKQLDRAQALAKRFLSASRLLYGDEHASTGGALDVLARIQAEAGLFAEAEQSFQASMAIARKLSGGQADRRVLLGLNNHADFLRARMKQPVQAEAEARAAVQMAKQLFAPDHLNQATFHMTLAETLLDQRRFAEAVDILVHADTIVAKFERQTGRPLLDRARNRLVLAQAQRDAGALSAAATTLKLAWDRLRIEGSDSPDRRMAEQMAAAWSLTLPAAAPASSPAPPPTP